MGHHLLTPGRETLVVIVLPHQTLLTCDSCLEAVAQVNDKVKNPILTYIFSLVNVFLQNIYS